MALGKCMFQKIENGFPESALEINKIQYNKDVGLSILESYSRVLETLANMVISRIKDVLYANSFIVTSPDQYGDAMDF
ncbi:rop guanine nucleotide exchange factor-like protein [Perilla frutescens var. hirtella]|nr:rop guanine nucleotide exchange factor-like protein [Perilla frutescens var. hirtella]